MGRAHSDNNEEGGPLVRRSAGPKIEVGLFVLIRISCTIKRVKHFIF